ncbi:hypothetical protein JDV02_009458 [Purpureocillium takamizusanense]|uniref:Tat pathway signal sequence n=1 Tax=Purpureocillium takamizusanense TaxID=2060973 RepID=A0A9Q8QQV7_9HYPO|nr:uncharacterized protein JDV02_009458 [Purpureocillium takamizusanense]UNI23651.1 hypothetical protein JDV02_009458 [Purpureocillium takamizusanense]
MSGPFYHQRTSLSSSRSSLPSMQAMPHVAQYSDGYNPAALPKGPLRVPQKHQRRSTGPSTYPPPYVSSDASTGNITPESRPSGGPAAGKETAAPDGSGGSSDRTEVPPAEGDRGGGGGHDKAWFAHRKRSCRFLVVVGVVTAIIVGLAVGLAVGLRRRGGTSGKGSSSNYKFPAGSYTFDMSLKSENQDCTSRASTWQCDGQGKGDTTTLYWNIKSLSPDTYTVSSAPPSSSSTKGGGTDNPLALPPFSNLKMRLVDANQPTERLVFSLPVNKTVVPSDGGTSLNRAAKCTYADAEVEATLYTRRHGGKSFDAPADAAGGDEEDGGAVAWPGDIEVAQLMNATIGQPTCEDSTGRQIADVQGASGTCDCMYANGK